MHGETDRRAEREFDDVTRLRLTGGGIVAGAVLLLGVQRVLPASVAAISVLAAAAIAYSIERSRHRPNAVTNGLLVAGAVALIGVGFDVGVDQAWIGGMLVVAGLLDLVLAPVLAKARGGGRDRRDSR